LWQVIWNTGSFHQLLKKLGSSDTDLIILS